MSFSLAEYPTANAAFVSCYGFCAKRMTAAFLTFLPNQKKKKTLLQIQAPNCSSISNRKTEAQTRMSFP